MSFVNGYFAGRRAAAVKLSPIVAASPEGESRQADVRGRTRELAVAARLVLAARAGRRRGRTSPIPTPAREQAVRRHRRGVERHLLHLPRGHPRGGLWRLGVAGLAVAAGSHARIRQQPALAVRARRRVPGRGCAASGPARADGGRARCAPGDQRAAPRRALAGACRQCQRAALAGGRRHAGVRRDRSAVRPADRRDGRAAVDGALPRSGSVAGVRVLVRAGHADRRLHPQPLAGGACRVGADLG